MNSKYESLQKKNKKIKKIYHIMYFFKSINIRYIVNLIFFIQDIGVEKK